MKTSLSQRGVSLRGNTFTKMKLPTGLALTVLACASLPTARAADIIWDATSPGAFTTPANWDGDVAPTAADNAIINNGGTAQIVASDNITVTTLQLLDGSVTQNGGTMFATAPEETLAAYSIGWAAGLTGSYTATGGASLSGGRAIIGNNGGTGTFTLSGGSIYNSDVGRRTDIGNGAGSTGTLTVNGGSSWTTNDWIIVGRNGTGTLNASGAGTTVTANGELFLGDLGGSGTMDISDGASVTGGNVLIGAGGGGTSSMTISGASNLTANGRFVVANGGTTGSATVSGTASITANEIFIGNNVGSVATFDVQGGTITSNSWTVIGRSASTGTVTLGGNSVWTKLGGGQFSVGNGFEGNGKGTITIKDSAKLDIQSGELWIGAEGSGEVPTDTQGTFNLNGGQVDTYSWVAVGRNNTTGKLNINGGVFNMFASGSLGTGANFVAIGNATAPAVINQTGGVFNNEGSDTIIAETDVSVAEWNATGGTANLNVLRAGGRGGSNGTVNISDNAVVNANVIYVSSDAGSTGKVNVTGGTLNAGHIEAGAGNRSLVFDGGQLNATMDDTNYIRDFHTGEVDLRAGGLNISTGAFSVGITTQLSGVGGIKKTGSGTLIIALPSDGPQDANTYSGETFVGAGTLEALNTNLGVGNVRVADGAHLILDINTAIGDLANLILEGDFSTLNLAYGSGEIETIGSLVVGGVVVPVGTYTATQLNSMFDGQFSGTGSLTVTTAIPEPSTVALAVIGLGAVMFLRRRRLA